MTVVLPLDDPEQVLQGLCAVMCSLVISFKPLTHTGGARVVNSYICHMGSVTPAALTVDTDMLSLGPHKI